MSLSAEDWGRQLAQCERDQAVAVFHTPDLTLTWANQTYLDLLDEPYRSNGAVGLALESYCPLEYVTQAELLRQVAAHGEPDSSEDRVFSVEDGMTVLSWSAHPVCPHHVVALIEVRRPAFASARVDRPQLALLGH